MVILNWGKMFLVVCDTWFYPSMIIGQRRRFHVNFFTCGAEQSPLDCILLKEGASAPQETAHTWTNNITMLPACFCSETAQKHIWQGRLCHHGNKGPSVYWVRAVDKSAQGTTHVSTLLPNNTGQHAAMPCPNKPTKSWLHRPHVATMSFPAVVASQYLLYQFHNLSNHLKYSFFVLKIKAHLHFRTYDETMSRSCLCLCLSLAASANSSWKMFLWLKRGAATRAALWHFHENTAQTIEKKTTNQAFQLWS